MDESTDTDEGSEPADQTIQQRILVLYESDELPQTAVGFWSKLLIEFAIVAVPVVLFALVPGSVAATMGLHPAITVPRVVGLSASFVVTVTGFTWCFTAATADE